MPPKKVTKKPKKRKKWTKKQLDVLYECWKGADSNKERLLLVEEKLPKVPSLAALNKMRTMAKSDSKWIGMATRKKNQKEKEKLSIELEKQRKRDEIEKKKLERERKRKEREEKRQRREEMRTEKTLKEKIKSSLLLKDEEKIKKEMDPKLFFCSKIHQFISEISCIFRIFSEEYGSPSGPCEKCVKMDKHIPLLQEVIKNGRQKRVRSNKASSGSKVKKKTKARRGSSPKKVTTAAAVKSGTGRRKSSKPRRNASTK